MNNSYMPSMILILLIKLIQVIYCTEQDIVPHSISDMAETFIKDQTEYILVNHDCSWFEARVICSSYQNATLAELHTEDAINFLASVLEASSFQIENVWVAAKRESLIQNFIWIYSGIDFDASQLLNRKGENVNPIRNCVAFRRIYHDSPKFVNMDCNLKRGFLCERPFDRVAVTELLTTPEWIKIGNMKYGIYYDRKTFDEALSECSKRKFTSLASFTSYGEVSEVAKYLVIGRPSLENAWIGGRFEQGAWMFLDSGKEISTNTDIITNFPPWRFNRTMKQSGCLMLDIHMKVPYFIETRCNRKRSFICSTLGDISSPQYQQFIMNNIGYIFYLTSKTWDKALSTCRVQNTTLAKVTQDNIYDVLFLMGETVAEIQNIWIGGRLTDDLQFEWTDGSLIVPDRADNENYPPWYNNDRDLRYACLNMERQNHLEPMFYGVACDAPQPFLCYQPNLKLFPKKIPIIDTKTLPSSTTPFPITITEISNDAGVYITSKELTTEATKDNQTFASTSSPFTLTITTEAETSNPTNTSELLTTFTPETTYTVTSMNLPSTTLALPSLPTTMQRWLTTRDQHVRIRNEPTETWKRKRFVG